MLWIICVYNHYTESLSSESTSCGGDTTFGGNNCNGGNERGVIFDIVSGEGPWGHGIGWDSLDPSDGIFLIKIQGQYPAAAEDAARFLWLFIDYI